jgi:hypothetical protein
VTTLAEHNLPGVPEWVRFGDPADADPAAFAAWLHASSRCVLLMRWYPDEHVAAGGTWVFDVEHPDGRRRTAWVAGVVPPSSEGAVLESAAAVVGELVRTVQQAR